jgi:16S rRNA (uracil1498-N3)-methyltransferase
MTRRRWMADEVEGDRAALTGAAARHLARVLRAHTGQEFEIAAGGRVRRGVVTRVSEQRVEFALGEEVARAELPAVTLLLAVFKFDRMEWAIEKATELGAARIVPVLARRTDAHLARAAGKRAERWRRIAREAAQQARRASPPEIAEPCRLKDALAQSANAAVRVVLWEGEEGVPLPRALGGGAAGATLAVGPEGGWTAEEMAEFGAAGWRAASLGPNILRAETAAVAALAVTLACLAQGARDGAGEDAGKEAQGEARPE